MSHGSAVRALVLARGLGTRMRAAGNEQVALDAAQASAAAAGLKAMIPFGDVPFLDHLLHRLADAGVRKVALVLGPEHEEVRSYYRSLETRRLAVSFVTQARPIGTADAVVAGETWVGDDPFLVMNADNLYPVDVIARLVGASGPAVPAFDPVSLALPMDRLGTFALMERDTRGCLSRIIEKPGEAAVRAVGGAAAISMNIWRFDDRIFPFCRSVPPSQRGERELPQAVGLAASAICFEVFDARGPVLDLSRRADVSVVARALDGVEVDL